jgi:hypothetical protein
MTAQHQHLNHAAGAEPDDAPAVIVTLETLSERADLVHRHRLAVAALRHEQAELADELRLREAQAYLTVQGEGKNEAERKAKHTLTLASDADYQRLVQRERAIKRAILEREADCERATFRLRLTLAVLPIADAIDMLDATLSTPRRAGTTAGAGGTEDMP